MRPQAGSNQTVGVFGSEFSLDELASTGLDEEFGSGCHFYYFLAYTERQVFRFPEQGVLLTEGVGTCQESYDLHFETELQLEQEDRDLTYAEVTISLWCDSIIFGLNLYQLNWHDALAEDDDPISEKSIRMKSSLDKYLPSLSDEYATVHTVSLNAQVEGEDDDFGTSSPKLCAWEYSFFVSYNGAYIDAELVAANLLDHQTDVLQEILDLHHDSQVLENSLFPAEQGITFAVEYEGTVQSIRFKSITELHTLVDTTASPPSGAIETGPAKAFNLLSILANRLGMSVWIVASLLVIVSLFFVCLVMRYCKGPKEREILHSNSNNGSSTEREYASRRRNAKVDLWSPVDSASEACASTHGSSLKKSSWRLGRHIRARMATQKFSPIALIDG